MGVLDALGLKLRNAVVSAINKTMAQCKTRIKERINAGYGVPKSDIEKAIQVNKATADNMTASLSIGTKQKRSFSLARKGFGAIQTSTGVTVKIGPSTKSYKHAFIAVMPSGHSGVFIRKFGTKHKPVSGRYAKYPSTLREKIVETASPSIMTMFNELNLENELRAFIEQKFPEILKHEIEYYTRN